MGINATKAAYSDGGDWHENNWKYIQENFAYLREFLKTRLPYIHLIEPEGTFFAWLDFSELGLDKKSLNDLIINKAGLWLDSGHVFGAASAQYQRIVMAAPRKVIIQALEQLEYALHSLPLSA